VWIEKILSVAYGLAWLQDAPPRDYEEDAPGFRDWVESSFPDRAVVHQHYRPTCELLDVAVEFDIRLVTTLRDPYDQFVSLFFYVQRFPADFQEADDPAQVLIGRELVDDAVLWFIETSFRRYLELGVAWLRSRRSLIIRYEDLSFRPEESVLRMARWIEPLGATAVQDALEAASADRMREIGPKYRHHIRAATVGDWRNHLGPAHLRAMEKHGDLVAALGYQVR
jgi:Sulfotransferase domain